MLTGNVRPGIWNTGTLQTKERVSGLAHVSMANILFGIKIPIRLSYPPKNLENLSAFRVADVTISLKSRLRATTFFNIPNKTSVLSDLSCASSMTITLQKNRERGKILVWQVVLRPSKVYCDIPSYIKY
jgi:hypothetical protein